MPELPDVEVFRRYFDSTALHQRIESAQVGDERILGETSTQELEKALAGCSFTSTRRHGKYLFAELEGGGGWLVLHFGMTGWLKYFKNPEEDTPHDRFRIGFENGFHLAYDCQRLLGRVDLTRDPEELIHEEGLGPDALSLDFSAFKGRLEGRRGAIKSALMNQKVVAGIGNIYTDEILFQAAVHPRRNAGELGEGTLRGLHGRTGEVMETAIECGADPEELPGSFLLPRREEGEECPGCGGEVEKIKVSGRTGYYCPGCQP